MKAIARPSDCDKSGFDIVIGNPPYVSHDNIPSSIPCKSFECFEAFADIYCYFYEIGLKALSAKGILCFITSNSFLRANYGLPLRGYIHEHFDVLQLIDIEGTQIFGAAIVNTVIALLTKSRTDGKAIIVNEHWGMTSLADFIKSNRFAYEQSDFAMQPWTLVSPRKLCLRRKIEKAGNTLEELGAKIRLGLATGDNKAFILDEQKRKMLIEKDDNNADLIKPVIRGQDIMRYTHIAPQYILLTKNDVDVQKDYPVIYEYLDSFGDKFKNRGAKGKHWTNLRACAFFDDFKKEKIIWIELTDNGRFSYSNTEEYLLNSAYFLIPPTQIDAKYLLGLLNSSVIRFYIRQIAATSGMGTLRWINNYVKQIPIPIADQTIQSRIVSLVEAILKIKAEDRFTDTSHLEYDIDCLFYEIFSLTKEDVKIVESN